MEKDAILCRSCKNKIFYHDSGYFFCNWCDQESQSELGETPCSTTSSPSPKRARSKRRTCKACGRKKLLVAPGRYYCKCNGRLSDYVKDVQRDGACGKTKPNQNSSTSCRKSHARQTISDKSESNMQLKTGSTQVNQLLKSDNSNILTHAVKDNSDTNTNILTIDTTPKNDSDKPILTSKLECGAKLPIDNTMLAKSVHEENILSITKTLQDLQARREALERDRALFDAFFKLRSLQINSAIVETKRKSSLTLTQDETDSEVSFIKDKVILVLSTITDKSAVERKARLSSKHSEIDDDMIGDDSDLSGIENKGNSVLSKIEDKDAYILSKIKDIDSSVLSKLEDNYGLVLSEIEDNDSSVLSKIKDNDNSVLSKLEDFVGSDLNRIVDKGNSVLSKIEDKDNSVLNKIEDNNSSILSKVDDNDRPVLSKIIDNNGSVLSKIADNKESFLFKLRKGADSVLSEIKNKFVANKSSTNFNKSSGEESKASSNIVEATSSKNSSRSKTKNQRSEKNFNEESSNTGVEADEDSLPSSRKRRKRAFEMHTDEDNNREEQQKYLKISSKHTRISEGECHLEMKNPHKESNQESTLKKQVSDCSASEESKHGESLKSATKEKRKKKSNRPENDTQEEETHILPNRRMKQSSESTTCEESPRENSLELPIKETRIKKTLEVNPHEKRNLDEETRVSPHRRVKQTSESVDSICEGSKKLSKKDRKKKRLEEMKLGMQKLLSTFIDTKKQKRKKQISECSTREEINREQPPTNEKRKKKTSESNLCDISNLINPQTVEVDTSKCLLEKFTNTLTNFASNQEKDAQISLKQTSETSDHKKSLKSSAKRKKKAFAREETYASSKKQTSESSTHEESNAEESLKPPIKEKRKKKTSEKLEEETYISICQSTICEENDESFSKEKRKNESALHENDDLEEETRASPHIRIKQTSESSAHKESSGEESLKRPTKEKRKKKTSEGNPPENLEEETRALPQRRIKQSFESAVFEENNVEESSNHSKKHKHKKSGESKDKTQEILLQCEDFCDTEEIASHKNGSEDITSHKSATQAVICHKDVTESRAMDKSTDSRTKCIELEEETAIAEDVEIHPSQLSVPESACSTIIQDTPDVSSCDEFTEMGIKSYGINALKNYSEEINETTPKTLIVPSQICPRDDTYNLAAKSFSDLLIPNTPQSLIDVSGLQTSMDSPTLESSAELQIDLSPKSPEKIKGARRVSARIASKLISDLQNSKKDRSSSIRTPLNSRRLETTKLVALETSEIAMPDSISAFSPIPQEISESFADRLLENFTVKSFGSSKAAPVETPQSFTHRLIQNLAKTPQRRPSVRLTTPQEGRIRYQSVIIKTPSLDAMKKVTTNSELDLSVQDAGTKEEVKSEALSKSLESNKQKERCEELKDEFEDIEESNMRHFDEILANCDNIFISPEHLASSIINKTEVMSPSPKEELNSSVNNEENNNLEKQSSKNATALDENLTSLVETATLITSTPIPSNDVKISSNEQFNLLLTPSARRTIRTYIKRKKNEESNENVTQSSHQVQEETQMEREENQIEYEENQAESEDNQAESEENQMESGSHQIEHEENQVEREENQTKLEENQTKLEENRRKLLETSSQGQNENMNQMETKSRERRSSLSETKSRERRTSLSETTSRERRISLSQNSENIPLASLRLRLKKNLPSSNLKKTEERNLSTDSQRLSNKASEEMSSSEDFDMQTSPDVRKRQTPSETSSVKSPKKIVITKSTRRKSACQQSQAGLIKKHEEIPSTSQNVAKADSTEEQSSLKLVEDKIPGPLTKRRMGKLLSEEKEVEAHEERTSMKLAEDIVQGKICEVPGPSTSRQLSKKVSKENEADVLEGHSCLELSEDIIPFRRRRMSKFVFAEKDNHEEHVSKKLPGSPTRTRLSKNVPKEKKPDLLGEDSSLKVLEDISSGPLTSRRMSKHISKEKEVDANEECLSMKLPEDLIPKQSTRRRPSKNVSKEKEADLLEDDSSLKVPEDIIPGPLTSRRISKYVSKEKEVDASEGRVSMKLPEDIISKQSTRRRPSKKGSKENESEHSSSKLPEELIPIPLRSRQISKHVPQEKKVDAYEEQASMKLSEVQGPSRRQNKNVSKEKEADVLEADSSLEVPEDIIPGPLTNRRMIKHVSKEKDVDANEERVSKKLLEDVIPKQSTRKRASKKGSKVKEADVLEEHSSSKLPEDLIPIPLTSRQISKHVPEEKKVDAHEEQASMKLSEVQGPSTSRRRNKNVSKEKEADVLEEDSSVEVPKDLIPIPLTSRQISKQVPEEKRVNAHEEQASMKLSEVQRPSTSRRRNKIVSKEKEADVLEEDSSLEVPEDIITGPITSRRMSKYVSEKKEVGANEESTRKRPTKKVSKERTPIEDIVQELSIRRKLHEVPGLSTSRQLSKNVSKENEADVLEEHSSSKLPEDLIPIPLTSKRMRKHGEKEVIAHEEHASMKILEDIIAGPSTRRRLIKNVSKEKEAVLEEDSSMQLSEDIMPEQSTRKRMRKLVFEEKGVDAYEQHISMKLPEDIITEQSTRKRLSKNVSEETDVLEEQSSLILPEDIIPVQSTQRQISKVDGHEEHPEVPGPSTRKRQSKKLPEEKEADALEEESSLQLADDIILEPLTSRGLSKLVPQEEEEVAHEEHTSKKLTEVPGPSTRKRQSKKVPEEKDTDALEDSSLQLADDIIMEPLTSRVLSKLVYQEEEEVAHEEHASKKLTEVPGPSKRKRQSKKVPEEKEADALEDSSLQLADDIILEPLTSRGLSKLVYQEEEKVAHEEHASKKLPEVLGPSRRRRQSKNVPKEKEAEHQEQSSLKLPEDVIPGPSRRRRLSKNVPKEKEAEHQEQSSLKLPEDVIPGPLTKWQKSKLAFEEKEVDAHEDASMKLLEVTGPSTSRRKSKKLFKEKEADVLEEPSLQLLEDIILDPITSRRMSEHVCKEEEVNAHEEHASRKLHEVAGPSTRRRISKNLSKEKEADVLEEPSSQLLEDIILEPSTSRRMSKHVCEEEVNAHEEHASKVHEVAGPSTRRPSNKNLSKEKEADVVKEPSLELLEDVILEPLTSRRMRKHVYEEEEVDAHEEYASKKLPKFIIPEQSTRRRLRESVSEENAFEEYSSILSEVAIPGPSTERQSSKNFLKENGAQCEENASKSVSMQMQINSIHLSSLPNTESTSQLEEEKRREENLPRTTRKRLRDSSEESESKAKSARRSRKTSESSDSSPIVIIRRRNTHHGQEEERRRNTTQRIEESESGSSSTTWSSLEEQPKRKKRVLKKQTTKKTKVKAKTKVEAKINKITKITTWDCYNYVLLGLVKEMIALGANEKLHDVVKVLWFKYLKKIEVLHDDPTKPPKLQVLNSHIDAEIIYGMSRDCEDPEATDDDQAKKCRTRHNKSLGSFSYTSKSKHVHFSSFAKTQLKRIMPSKEVLNESFGSVKSPQKLATWKDVSSVMTHPGLVLTKSKLYGLIYLGLLITQDKIKMGDILRFIQEGSLSFNKLQHFLPENIDESALRHYSLHKVTPIISAEGLRNVSGKLAEFIGVEDVIPAVNLFEIVERYCEELNLPDEFVQYIHKLIYKTKPKMKLNKPLLTLPNYDARAISFIIFGLKRLLGLDGATEYELSKTATTLGPKMFNFKNWMEHIYNRRLFINEHHFPSYYTASVGAAELPSIYTSYIRKIGLENVASNKLKSLEKHLKRYPRNETESYEFEQSLTPQRDFVRRFGKSSQHQSEVLSRDFKGTSIRYLYDPEVYKDYKVKVKHRGVHENVEFVPLATHSLTFRPTKLDCSLGNAHTCIATSAVEKIDSQKILKKYNQYYKPTFEDFKRQFESEESESKQRITIYNPAERFWIYLTNFINLTNESYNEYFNSLPCTFQQVVQECAQIIQQSTKDVLAEYNILEAYLCEMQKEEQFGCSGRGSSSKFITNNLEQW